MEVLVDLGRVRLAHLRIGAIPGDLRRVRRSDGFGGGLLRPGLGAGAAGGEVGELAEDDPFLGGGGRRVGGGGGVPLGDGAGDADGVLLVVGHGGGRGGGGRGGGGEGWRVVEVLKKRKGGGEEKREV